ncbi:MAG: mechanosensitive ion channel family protein [Sulfurimonas sp.]|uniref:mechanosensitive ion channel family protein n=1 Tax=Sulfurimonas sp. TaxID=2022749 RepID=UPI002622DB2B|nr:mechanosensitive ion channel family protein [Sulfurimonas sp.]MCW8896070.1 mechanosensitive ion channel family protein [Sulfurimonas sp.]MCW8954997.1 mechanosensitive ion channel family protein [Sulfurimonas sp.]MCW9067627.1 mechanosensitive ion channel family protein [Sulfurimonas sp.]
MKKFIMILIAICSFSQEITAKKNKPYEYLNIDNQWLKIYKNVKSYDRSISLIATYENQLIKANKNNDLERIRTLNKKLNIQQSKLLLFQKNNNLMVLINPYLNFVMKEVDFFDYLLESSLNNVDNKILQYNILINEYNLAKSHLEKMYKTKSTNSENEMLKKVSLKELESDIEYFKDFKEIIDKSEQNLIDSKIEIKKAYKTYYENVLVKHLITLVIILIAYILHLLNSKLSVKLIKQDEDKASYKKLGNIIFTLIVIITISLRYSDNILHALTLLSVIGAALTIATREIILNIAGWVYIFSTSIVKQGNRVLFLVGTKHTVGDIKSITLMKMTLNEVEDYSNLKEIKNAGRRLHIPNSYIFTQVFYNYSTANNGIIRDLIEIDFDLDNDFEFIEQITKEVFDRENIIHQFSIQLNSLKTSMSSQIWYETQFKTSLKNRGDLTIKLLNEYKKYPEIQLKKSPGKSTKLKDNEIE